ncbi:MAG: ATP-binding cassette domain-containing protein [Microscillaceae bacterium]|nr:ATP-binding cassette domain-containing protein [Microscillaceae bacterium]
MDYILEVKNITKSYANHRALHEVSLNIPRGSIVGLLGPNGAGKTSLIRIITQIIGQDSGEILFNGEPLMPKHIARIGYLPEERGLYRKMKVGEQLLYLAQLKGLSRKEALAKLKIWFEKFDIKTWWNKNVQDLSKGMAQKVQFVATVLHEPELIILDEPFSGFDPVNASLIKDEILELREKGSTIIFSTHRMESVEELCEYVILINKSEKILDGLKREIKQRYKTNTYTVDYKGHLNGQLSADYSILSSEEIDLNFIQASIQTPQGASPNDLIKELINHVEVHNFQEKIPSMEEIFIMLVSGNTI